jgi:hypothetical protein
VRIAATLVLGLFVGFVGAMVQWYSPTVAGRSVPVGAIIALLAVVPVARACAWWAGSRRGAIGFSVGWLAATLMMGSETPGGDLVLTGSGDAAVSGSLAYLLLGTMALSAACGYPLLPEDDTPEPLDPLGNVVVGDA